MTLVTLHTFRKRQETFGFLMFSESIEKVRSYEMS